MSGGRRGGGPRRRAALGAAALGATLAVAPLGADTAGVVVAGLGGTPDYAESFERDASTIAAALESLSPGGGAIARLGADGEPLGASSGAASGPTAGTAGDARTGPSPDAATGGPADARASILAEIERRGRRGAEVFALVLIGHGTADARGWKFNLAGPDLTGDDLVAALATVEAARQIVVLGASASGALLETLAAPGRVVVTATKSGGETNAVRFPGSLAEALESDAADLDRNEILTVAEAFRYADARTREYYDERNLLASEHARLVGEDAASLALARLGSLRLAGDDPTVATLLETRLSLERDYHALLARKGDLAPDDYYAELETLMLSIAALQRAIDRASGWSDEDA